MSEIDKVDTETTKKDSEGVEEETENTDSEESEGESEEKSEERPKETLEQQKGRLERALRKINTKLGVETEEKPKPKSKVEKSDEFDEGQLAYLVAKGIESDEDVDFTRDELKKHGGNLRELLGNEYFKAKITARKEARTVLEATPSNSRRTSSRPGDAVEVEYAKYLKTGKLPDDREMRTKLVNMRLKKETVDNQFTDQSVIGG